MRARARGAAVSGKSGSRAGVIFRGGPPHFSRALYRPSRVQCTPTRRAAPSAGACIHRRGGLHGSRALFVVSPINVYIRGRRLEETEPAVPALFLNAPAARAVQKGPVFIGLLAGREPRPHPGLPRAGALGKIRESDFRSGRDLSSVWPVNQAAVCPRARAIKRDARDNTRTGAAREI